MVVVFGGLTVSVKHSHFSTLSSSFRPLSCLPIHSPHVSGTITISSVLLSERRFHSNAFFIMFPSSHQHFHRSWSFSNMSLGVLFFLIFWITTRSRSLNKTHISLSLLELLNSKYRNKTLTMRKFLKLTGH